MLKVVEVSEATLGHFMCDVDMIGRAVRAYECLDYMRIKMAQLSQLLFYLLLLLRSYFNGAKEYLLRRLSYSRGPQCRLH